MPKTEHDAPSAKELRDYALSLCDMVEALDKSVDVSPDVLAVADILRRLASGPTLEERLIDACARYSVEGGTDDTAAELVAVIKYAHARKLSEEAGG